MTIGLSNWTSTAWSLLASSTEYSTAYVYADVGGSSPGIAAGPLAPIVNSVARMFSRSPSSFSVPSGSVAVASVPGSISSVARREPSPSVIVEPCATCSSSSVEVHAGDAVLVGDHDDLLDALELLRRDLELALGGHVALALERERDASRRR